MGVFFKYSSFILSTLVATNAMAQDKPAPADAGTLADTGQNEGELTDIIVTAQKRSENLQRTAAAVTVLNQESIVAAGITDLVSAQGYIPSVRLQNQNSSTQIYIRGVGSSNDFANTEQPTSLNFNGVPIPREAGSVPFFDIAGIEVLPGPQGTLYGKSTLGGAVNVNFARPTKSFQSVGLLEVGNYDAVRVSVAQNVPLSNALAVRAAIDYNRHDGYLKSGSAAADDLAGRLSILYEPNNDFSAYLWGYAARKAGTSTNLVNKGFNPATGQVDGASFLNPDPWDDRLPAQFALFGQVRAIPIDDRHYGAGTQIDWTRGDIKFTDIAGYIRFDGDRAYFLGPLSGQYNAKIQQISNEFRISGESQNLKWLTGVNYYRMVNSDLAQLRAGPINIFTNIIDRNRSQGFGIFGQATYSLTDALRLTAGARYSDDSRTGRGRVADATGAPNRAFTADVSSNHFDWKAGLEYDASGRVMIYANTQTGYQPATYNAFPNSATFNNRVGAPTIRAFVAGFKSRLLDNKLQFNSEAFYYIYKGLPLQAFSAALSFNALFNSQRVEIYGNQTDIRFQPTRNDQLSLSVGYLHARQTKAITPDGQDYSGLQAQNAPDWTVVYSYSHDFEIGSGYLRAGADTRYESSFFGDYEHSPGTRQKPYTKTGASLIYHAAEERWTLGAWIINIEDRAVAAGAGSGSPIGGVALINLQPPPRTFGLRATAKF